MRWDEFRYFVVGAFLGLVVTIMAGIVTQYITREFLGFKVSVIFGSATSMLFGLIWWYFMRLDKRMEGKLDKSEFTEYKNHIKENNEEFQCFLESIDKKQDIILETLLKQKQK